MAETFPWMKARRTLQDPPEPGTATVECPACGWTMEVPPWLILDDDYRVHLPGHEDSGLGPDVCWVGGWSLKDAHEMVAMRSADDGRLPRKAHP